MRRDKKTPRGSCKGSYGGKGYREKNYGENCREYQERLTYYRSVLQEKPVYKKAVDSCMENKEKECQETVILSMGVENAGNGISHQRVREEVFLHVWLPVLTEYVEWVLDEAVKSGKERLYFLARDGYMMYLMAKKIVEARGIALDIRYLKLSRFAIRSAEYYFAGKAALDTLCTGGIDISFEKIMKRANLTKAEVLHIAKLAGYTKNYKAVLNYQQLCRLKKELAQIEPLFVYLQKHAKDHYHTAIAYLKQEGLLEQTPYALVDSGWTGSLQLSLQRVLEHGSGKKVRLEGYYFGLYDRPEGTESRQYRTFYFDKKEVRRKVSFSNCLFETVFSAPEGMTCGYRISGQRQAKTVYEAIEDGRNPNAEVLEHFARLLMQYVSYYVKVRNAKVRNIKARNVKVRNVKIRNVKDTEKMSNRQEINFFTEKLFKPMMGYPTRWEAEAFGRMLFCDDVLELQLQPVAVKWDKEELCKQRFFQKLLIKANLKANVLHESAWTEGSIVRSGKKTESLLWQERLYKSLMYLRKAVNR
ncbi:MAG: hypothetical protein NC318_09620 [Blautia sp.]|nr:hypothetical protein [Lachnoclostridium sp.]MCM1211848.1 hypothetical protein [Blautia sp.]